MRKVIAVVLILLGLVMCVASISIWIISVHPPLGLSVTIILGVLLLVAGILIFITEVLESWLSHGQAALVDGLQAG